MSQEQGDQERPCLHCMMVDLIDDFFAEYPATAASDKVDTAEADEVIDAIAKTVAELTSQQGGVIRQQVIEHLMRHIMHYDAEGYRRLEPSKITVGGSIATPGSPSILRASPSLTANSLRLAGRAHALNVAAEFRGIQTFSTRLGSC